jgi:glycine/D-amino acid oxidase-like deaminating enzyme
VTSRVFDDNHAVWLEGAADDTPAPPLEVDLDVDVAIIGGGFTGVTTAYHLSQRFPERRIALLEAKRIANGASGRNGGMMLNGISFTEDPDVAAREYALTKQTVDDVEALIRKHALRVRFRRDGCVHLATSQKSADEAQAHAEQLASRGVPLRFTRDVPSVLRVRNGSAFGATIDPNEGLINGVDLLRAMRPLLGGVHVYESTPVTRIREGDTITLATPRATVRAKAIVLATSGYTPHLGYFRTGLLPVISHVIATDPLPPDRLARIGLDKHAGFFDDLPRLAYCGVDTEGRLLFGGGATNAYAYRFNNATTYDAKPGDTGARATRDVLLNYLPELADIPIRHRWSGPLDLALRRFVAMGVLGKNIFYSVGYSGHGVTLANLAGRVLTDLYSDVHEPWRDYAFYMKRPTGIPPEPFRWLGYQLIARLTGQSPWKRPE